MQVPEARNPTWMSRYGRGVADMCCNSHRQFITQTRAIVRVKRGSTISNLSGKQARFKMTWANYYAWACICSCGFCIKLIWLYRVPSTWSSSVLVTEPKVLKNKGDAQKTLDCWTQDEVATTNSQIACYSKGIGFKVRQPWVETQTPTIHC